MVARVRRVLKALIERRFLCEERGCCEGWIEHELPAPYPAIQPEWVVEPCEECHGAGDLDWFHCSRCGDRVDCYEAAWTDGKSHFCAICAEEGGEE